MPKLTQQQQLAALAEAEAALYSHCHIG